MAHPLPPLTLLETRVAGVLAEKQRTVPDTYPLTLNALVSGCNQKTSRDPVLDASESEVQAAIDTLKGYSMVLETSGGRVSRYAHNIDRVLQVPAQSCALLTVLMLRGPQTAGELRIACERLHRFADISSVESFLTELAERPAGALVLELPRAPGARETRWTHLLSGVPDVEAYVQAPVAQVRTASPVAPSELMALQTRVEQLEEEVSALKALVGRLAPASGDSA